MLLVVSAVCSLLLLETTSPTTARNIGSSEAWGLLNKTLGDGHLAVMRAAVSKMTRLFAGQASGAAATIVGSLSFSSSWANGVEYDVVIVGAGLAGAVLADLYARGMGLRVLVVERKSHLGGSCHDLRDAGTGVLANMYGVRVLATNDEAVWGYMQRHGEWAPYEHRVVAAVASRGGLLVPFSVNVETVRRLVNSSIDTVASLREWGARNEAIHGSPSNGAEAAKRVAGDQLYQELFKPYLEGLWGVDPELLEASVASAIPKPGDWDDRLYPSKKLQGFPVGGYTRWFERAFDHPRINVMLSTDYYQVEGSISRAPGRQRTFVTGQMDTYFRKKRGSQLPGLTYRRSTRHVRRSLEYTALPCVHVELGKSREVEYKHYGRQQTNETIVVTEGYDDCIGECEGVAAMLVPLKEKREAFDSYKRLAVEEGDMHGVHFVGSFATYEPPYLDGTVKQVMGLFEKLEGRQALDRALGGGGLSAAGRGKKYRVHVVVSLYSENITWMQVRLRPVKDPATLKGDLWPFVCGSSYSAYFAALCRGILASWPCWCINGRVLRPLGVHRMNVFSLLPGKPPVSSRTFGLCHYLTAGFCAQGVCAQESFRNSEVDLAWFIYVKKAERSLEQVKTEVMELMLTSGGCVGASVTVTRLPNLGREGHTWLAHLFSSDFGFGDANLFLQGGAHSPATRISCYLRQLNSSLWIHSATRASDLINRENDIRTIPHQLGRERRNGELICNPEIRDHNRFWHIASFSKLKLGNGLDRLTRKSPRSTMVRYFNQLDKPYGMYTSGKHLFFYTAEFVVTEALIRRMLMRQRR